MQPPSLLQIFLTFLQLGCTSFGGPAAHLVFFHRKMVQQLHWINDIQYQQLIALAQLLPGPSSSQVGIGLGYMQRGYLGALMAWLGFTLPSAILMALVAVLGQRYFYVLNSHSFHVIQLIVFAVVSWAFWQMLRSFCKSGWQFALMVASALFLTLVPLSFNQILAIVLAGLLSIAISKYSNKVTVTSGQSVTTDLPHPKVQKKQAICWGIAFVLPFIVVPALVHALGWSKLHFFTDFYQTGSLVFGGGHVILPLLRQDFVSSGMVSAQAFDLGYAFAQLMPGPLFNFATYIGTLLDWTDQLWLNALLATVAIFLPSFFLMFATLPYWSWLMQQALIRQAVMGINAAVVGLLLYLVFELGHSYLTRWEDITFVILMIVLLRSKIPLWFSLIAGFALYTSYLSFF
ncbi:chromate efflux transporter [Acinetobacter thermotolerans]|uniref:chromate efflux transporter n=1 Tax=Acinetobacter thermotolerans TaxID=3151487 RepID=UPI00325B2C39